MVEPTFGLPLQVAWSTARAGTHPRSRPRQQAGTSARSTPGSREARKLSAARRASVAQIGMGTSFTSAQRARSVGEKQQQFVQHSTAEPQPHRQDSQG